MDLIQPGNGRTLSQEEKKQVQELLPGLEQAEAEFKTLVYQSPTLTFTDKIALDLGNCEVQVMHLGWGNTPGDAIVYLPKEKIIIPGDLLVKPIPSPTMAIPPNGFRRFIERANWTRHPPVPSESLEPRTKLKSCTTVRTFSLTC
jgi:glyoxylase-like metal-dependent hydrolase (beta-lactamase superfamily II)